MSVHDNYDKEILKQLKRIANSLEGIEKKLPNVYPIDNNGTYVVNDCLSEDKHISFGEPMIE